MAYTQQQLEAGIASLNDAIASGVRSALIGGQQITYNTSDSLIRARNDLQNQLNGLLGAGRRSRQAYGFLNGRGYD